MLGTEDEYGVMGLTFSELFKRIDDLKKKKDFKILMSYLEIYNENIRDLLSTNESGTGINKNNLDLREDS
jgi:predicted CopG family antitoxin